jgi:hypothetical protein
MTKKDNISLLIFALVTAVTLQGIYIWQRYTHPAIGMPFFIFQAKEERFDNYFRAIGAWVSDSKVPAVKKETVQLLCQKDWGRCIDTSASVNIGLANVISIQSVIFAIDAWTPDEIRGTAENAEACFDAALRIDRTKSEITKTMNNRQPLPEGCDKDAAETILRLSDSPR